MNEIIIKGRLTSDPELRKTQSDVSVCSFDVAVNRRFDKETADFFRCTAWRQAAETIAKYFTKGKEILIRGEMQSRKWVDNDGNNRLAWEILVEQFEFCGSKSDSAPQSSPKSSQKAKVNPNLNIQPEEGEFKEIPEDDLPF